MLVCLMSMVVVFVGGVCVGVWVCARGGWRCCVRVVAPDAQSHAGLAPLSPVYHSNECTPPPSTLPSKHTRTHTPLSTLSPSPPNTQQQQQQQQQQQRVASRHTCASVAFWNASKIFFSATTWPDFFSTARHTTPYAPLPRRWQTVYLVLL